MRQNGNGRKKARKIPAFLTAEEQARMLSQMEPADTPSKLRNLAMLRVLLNCGLRSAELCTLKTKNIDFKTGMMKVLGKGNRERVLWVGVDDLLLLKNWLEKRPCNSPLVFTSLDGEKPICSRWLRKLLPRLAERAGIDKRVHIHTCRHSFASDLLRQTKNLVLVQRALGHSNIATTTIYTHISDPELETAMKNLRNGEEK
mgnify:CR=1 FL=1